MATADHGLSRHDIDRQTIADFGDQWSRYRDNSGYYGSVDLLADVLEPLLPVAEIAGKRVAEIGSGSGRIVSMLLAAGAAHVTAIEPSDAMSVCMANTAHGRDRITYARTRGDDIPKADFDLVLSIGVIHHIVDPLPTLRAAHAALRPGGKLAIWVYGREGNGFYLTFVRPLRALVHSLPHPIVAMVVAAIYWPACGYMTACRLLPLPLHTYMRSVLAPLTPDKRRLVIYDQLRPAYAKYYREAELRNLLSAAGFSHVRLHRRHGYSWTALAEC